MDHNNIEQQAVSRLFDLVRSGDTGNFEFGQLDSMIYDSLVKTYRPGEESEAETLSVTAG